MDPQYRHFRHEGRLAPAKEEAARRAVENLDGWSAAVTEIQSWPEYELQPLHSLPELASRVGVKDIFYKDESQRFGRVLGSFKALGAPYAVFSLLQREVLRATGHRPTAEELRAGRFRAITERVTVCVATDGNQGRGLAYAAKTFGCRCVDYIHNHVSSVRKNAMEELGAVVIRIDGEYEASVARAKEDARMNGWHFVSSTSWDDFTEPLPKDVMNAYMVMVEEAIAQVPDLSEVTHVFMQGGVGSIAAAIYLGFEKHFSADNMPRFVLVEPDEADCLFQSASQGRPTPSEGTLRTIMAGLACREVSPAAWKVLDWLTSDFVAIPDSSAANAMTALAQGNGDIPIVCGESAAGGTAVLLESIKDADLKQRLALDSDSRVILFGAEGATDPEIYNSIVGQTPDDVFSKQTTFKNSKLTERGTHAYR